jgi:hypothetical protein
MPRIYDKIDMLWTSRGDYFISEGDLMDTQHDPLRSLLQEMKTRVEADQGDWRVFEDVGANLRDFVGEPNDEQTAELIKTRITAAFARNGFVHTQDIKLQYMPVARDKLLVRASISVAPTARNASSEVLIRHFLYNYSDNNVYFIGA